MQRMAWYTKGGEAQWMTMNGVAEVTPTIKLSLLVQLPWTVMKPLQGCVKLKQKFWNKEGVIKHQNADEAFPI